MKTLSDADYALIKSRGKVECLTTVRDFDMPPKVENVKEKDKVKHELVGKILHTSWGYDMTMNDFCKILEVSPSGKTVKCRMVHTVTNGHEHYIGGGGKAKAGTKEYGPYFRLKVKKVNWSGKEEYSFNGSYPFCGAENIPLNAKKSEYSNRMGYFSITSPNTEYYENHVD